MRRVVTSRLTWVRSVSFCSSSVIVIRGEEEDETGKGGCGGYRITQSINIDLYQIYIYIHIGKFSIYLIFVVAGAHTGSMQAIMCAILSPSLEIACALNVGITCVFCFGGIPPRLLFAPSRIIQVRVFVCLRERARAKPSLPPCLSVSPL